MADEKNQEKPFASGIISQTTGQPGETVQKSYNTEVIKERPQPHVPLSPSRTTVEKRG